MQSKRKRAARCQDETAQDLLQAFRTRRAVAREGTFPVLRWLVQAQCVAARKAEPRRAACDVLDVLNAANVDEGLPTAANLDALEQRVVDALQQPHEVPPVHLSYAAHFFKWWAKVVAATSTPRLGAPADAAMASDWLDPGSLERSLVVPDVRRSAIKILQLLSVRPGEFEIAAEVSGIKSRSCSAVLQALRTGEWNVRVQQTLMYGTLTDIYNAGMLDAVYFSIVDGRYVGRLAFAWVDNVLVAPGKSRASAAAPWPLVLAHNKVYVLCWRGAHRVYASAVEVYRAWASTCLDMGGIIGGRYDVRKCTI